VSAPAPHDDSERLTAEERARLRPSVDAAALERFLAEPPPPAEVHPATGPGTVSYVTIPTDNLYVNVSPPEDDPELRALWDAIEPGGPGQ
jgi:hypothetical protein